MSPVYRIRNEKVINETLDGETIIINLETGTYYSINASGSIVWSGVEKQAPVDQTIDRLLNLYDADRTTIEKDVNSLIAFLIAEQLITESEQTNLIVIEPSSAKELYLTPKIEKYEDMQEMLLADPVHDVDDTGWPLLKK